MEYKELIDDIDIRLEAIENKYDSTTIMGNVCAMVASDVGNLREYIYEEMGRL